MSQEQPEVPPLPEPWQPSAGPIEPSAPPLKGCGNPLLLGCACLLVLSAGLSAVFMLKVDDFVNWWLGQAERMVTEGLPAETDEATQQRLREAFADFRQALESGAGDAGSIARMQSALGNAVRKATAGTLEHVDVVRLIEALEAASGQDAPSSTPSPAGAVEAAVGFSVRPLGLCASAACEART